MATTYQTRPSRSARRRMMRTIILWFVGGVFIVAGVAAAIYALYQKSPH